ncbi:LuxE family acyl-protein synthetase (plasmid) [Metabacillus halosaccharovorans]|uniref:LuxE/PaaK family acyltransferase n=1 Tax=Metabacillus halosaccharovorans TaxID=930124 RepID=UPI0020411D5F|nr:LuxE family acyl-protein synthetase [Metabacillus halosaccharovorans]MCM3441341.1 LuxE family acyl-protein synthetase [Metabacillus halosaccharovorans]
MNLAKQLRDLGLNPLNTLVGSSHDLYKLPFDTVNQYKGSIIAENFKHHYENNEFYRDVCKKKQVTPDDIKGFDDLVKIPLIPVQTFKQCDSHLLMTSKLNEVEYEMRSTGTSGIPSVSRRDKITVDNAFESVVSTYREFFQISRGMGLFLFPPTEEMPEMGMVKALNIFNGLLDGAQNVVKRITFNPERAVELLNSWEGKHTRHLVGPPFLIYKLIKHCMDNNIKLNLEKKSYIITLGGWKRFTGEEIPREEFNKLCNEYLGVEINNVRDMYGLVEANMLAVECEHQEKHVPPWVHLSLRNPRNVLEEVEYGERGVIAIYDPTCTSYPGFVLTEDVGYLRKDTECECGRNGQKLVYISRMPGVEVGCCAINLEKFIEEKEKQVVLSGGE